MKPKEIPFHQKKRYLLLWLQNMHRKQTIIWLVWPAYTLSEEPIHAAVSSTDSQF
jgi:hypothetical protein